MAISLRMDICHQEIKHLDNMNVNIESTIDQEAINKSVLVNELEELLKREYCNLNYGKDVENISIKLSIVNPPIGFEHLYKTLPPKYIDRKEVKNRYTGEINVFMNHFFFSIIIIGNEYKEFISSSNQESKNQLARKILESLENLDRLPKKVKDFDKEKFKMDIEQFFKEQKLV